MCYTIAFDICCVQHNGLPPWLREYMAGASQELYKLHAFPTALLGQTVLDATSFIFDNYHAVLLAVEPTSGPAAHSMLVADLQQVCGSVTSDLM
jgi:hypothetical protein